jgi:hypothetical protein
MLVTIQTEKIDKTRIALFGKTVEMPGLFYRIHPAILPWSTAVLADKMPHDGVLPRVGK